MPLIDQDIPYGKKNTEWIIANLRAISQDVEVKKSDRIRDLKCRAMWNADQDNRDFEYLTRVGEYDLPAFVRFIPLIRPKGERLKGDFIERPFNYTIFASDEKSVRNRFDMQQQMFYQTIQSNLFNQLGQIQAYSRQLYEALQQPQQTTAEYQGEEGIVQGPPAPQTVIPPDEAMKMQIAQKVLEMQGLLTQQDIQKIEEKLPMSSLQMHEELAKKGLEYLRYTTDLDKKFYDGFEQKLITDKPYFLVDWDSRYENPYLQLVNSDNFYYAYDDEIEDVQESEWQCIEKYMSTSNIITRFRFDLKPSDYAKLEERRSRLSSTSNSFYYNGSEWNNYGQSVYSNYSPANLERVRMYWFRSPRRVVWKKVPNKYLPGEFHRKMVDETDILPDSKRDGEEYEAFYLDEAYEGIQVGDNIFFRCRKKPVVLRSIDHFGKINLPVMGPAVYSKGKRPYSVVYAASDVQTLWNITHYHKELWMALSGVKGAVMDKSQMPDLMSDTEWRYQRKLGTMYIQSEKRGKQFAFNQFREFDDSLSQGFTQLMNLVEHLDQLCGKIMGIPDPRMGDNSPYDKVGNVDKSIRQSTLQTESIYWEYDLLRRKACERLINLTRLAWKNGKVASYVDQEEKNVILNIPPGMLFAADYKMHLKPGGLEQKKIETLRQIVMNTGMAANIRLSQLSQLFTKDSLMDMQSRFEKIEKDAQEQAQAAQDQQFQQASQLEQQKAQIEMQKKENELRIKGEIDAQLKDMDNQVKQFANELQQAKMEIENLQKQGEFKLKQYVEDNKNQTDLAGIESERMTELAYLDEERRQFDITMGIKGGGENKSEGSKSSGSSGKKPKKSGKDVDVSGPMTIDRKRKEKIK